MGFARPTLHLYPSTLPRGPHEPSRYRCQSCIARWQVLRPLMTYLLPSATLMLAAFLLMLSMFLPYWSMTLFAPQYPKGLKVDVFVNQLVGDVQEIDALNHYLGMPPLDEGGQLERQVSMIGIVVLGFLLIAGVFVHNKWAPALAIPALTFPFVFLADLYRILYRYGHSIDPKSARGRGD